MASPLGLFYHLSDPRMAKVTLSCILRELAQMRDREQQLRFIAVRFECTPRGDLALRAIAGIMQARHTLRLMAYSAHVKQLTNSKMNHCQIATHPRLGISSLK